jgi:hypothetical protein
VLAIAGGIILAVFALEAMGFAFELFFHSSGGSGRAPSTPAPKPERKRTAPPISVTLQAGERYPHPQG